MPNGRARSQRSRAANARRNRARGRASARRTAAAEPSRIIAILDELEQGEPDIDRKLLFFKGLQRFVTEGAGSDLLEIRQLAHGLNSMSDTFAEFDQDVADYLCEESNWGVPVTVIQTAVQNLKACGVSDTIVVALEKSQLPAAKPTKVSGATPDPEPAPGECMTCCLPFATEKLVGCQTTNCTYLQCLECIIKDGGGACARPGCLHIHMKCPNCREKQVLKTADGDCMELTALPPELLYRTLDTVRERLRIHVKTAHENVLNALDTFGSDIAEVLSDMQSVP